MGVHVAQTAELLKGLTEHVRQHCFLQWQRRTQQCIDAGGHYIEGDIY